MTEQQKQPTQKQADYFASRVERAENLFASIKHLEMGMQLIAGIPELKAHMTRLCSAMRTDAITSMQDALSVVDSDNEDDEAEPDDLSEDRVLN